MNQEERDSIEGEEMEKKPEPRDAEVELTVSADRMEATIVVRPPSDGGKDITERQISTALQEAGIVYGLRSSSFPLVEKLKMYNKPLVVAAGKPPVDGRDGEVVDHFPHSWEHRPLEEENGRVDFKNLNMVHNIAKGALISELIPPTPPESGTDVYGKPVEGRPGVEPVIHEGKNTVLEDGKLMAACDGNLDYIDGRFTVEDVLRINGSINNEVGNIDFCGDVVIEGDVYEGFFVRSKKNVEIKGNVEGAEVTAKGSITLRKGMNGMGKGVLKAGQDVHIRFLESCTVTAGGCVYAESAMNATIYAEDKIIVTERRGAIVGGSYTAKNSIEAKVIGSPSHIATTVTLGISPEKLREYGQINEELRNLQKELDALILDLAYLEERSRTRRLNEKQGQMLTEKRRQKTQHLMRTRKLKQEAEQIESLMENAKQSRLTCQQIFPPTQVRIGNESISVQAVESKCVFYLNDKHKLVMVRN